MKPIHVALMLLSLGFVLVSCNESSYKKWEVYGGGADNIRYSALRQIDTSNVTRLTKLWEYRAGDADTFTQIQTNPIVIGNTLFGVSPKLKLFALDAATGAKKWEFDPYAVSSTEVKGIGYFSMNVCRGVTYYAATAPARLFYAAGSSLFCINAEGQ